MIARDARQTPLLRLSAGSDLAEVDLVGAAVETALAEAGLGAEEVEELTMAVREAVINAIRHGNLERPHRRVEVEVDRGPEEVVVRVADQGGGFDPDQVPDPTAPENLLKPSGRGILLMRRFVDSVEYSLPSKKGTVVTLRKRIAAPQEEKRE